MLKEISGRDHLPAELSRPAQEMELTRQANMLAFDHASEVYAYNFAQAASTLSFTSLIYQAARARGLMVEEEDGFRQLTKEYLSTAKSITHLANTDILLSPGRTLTTLVTGDRDGGSPLPALHVVGLEVSMKE